MPLPEHERRQMERLEQQLASEDPHLLNAMAPHRFRSFAVHRFVVGVVAFLAGAGILLLGVGIQSVATGVAGFLLMLLGSLQVTSRAALAELRRRCGPPGTSAQDAESADKHQHHSNPET
jgi:hypothetical protein